MPHAKGDYLLVSFAFRKAKKDTKFTFVKANNFVSLHFEKVNNYDTRRLYRFNLEVQHCCAKIVRIFVSGKNNPIFF